MLRALMLFPALTFSAFALAQAELPAPIPFGDGEFTFARGEDEEVALSYNGLEIYRNAFVIFNTVAKVDGVDVALFSGGEGGNACGPAQILITLPENDPDPKLDIIGEDCGAPDPAVSPYRVVFAPYFVAPGTTEDFWVWTPAASFLRMGALHFLPQEGTSWETFDPVKLSDPRAFFDNKDIYDAALALLGDRLGEVATGLSVSTQPEMIGTRFAVGYGCAPHACGVADAFFALDLEKKSVFAASRQGNEPETFWPSDFKSWPRELQTAYEKSKTP